MMRNELIEKILKRVERMTYTTNAGKINKDYSDAYCHALFWVLEECLGFYSEEASQDDTYQSLATTVKNEND